VQTLPHVLDTAFAARMLVADQFCVKPGETVLVTADSGTDRAAVEALLAAAASEGAKAVLMLIPQLPFQGKLADPYIPDAVAHAAAASDVWLDMTFPYMAGSSAHDKAMKAGRTRYLLLGDVNAGALRRLYGAIKLDTLFEVQRRIDDLMVSSSGASCRSTSSNGTDFSFRLGKPGGKKKRQANSPGGSTIMGSCIFYPEPDSVRGVIALDAMFHEYYSLLPAPIRLHVDGEIREIEHIRDHEAVTERALRRAANGNYGRVIHLTCGFHPAARFAGVSFIEDIRTVGANAIGLGVPWWEPGGGENHPDGVVSRQSLWVDGEQVVQDGRIVAPADLASAMRALEQAMG
jgi:2,5-dihydroxypyridine 5,6-dioxygenase